MVTFSVEIREAASAEMLLFKTGCTSSPAISDKGCSTNLRFCNLGCGILRLWELIISLLKKRMSRSMLRGPSIISLMRPILCSISSRRTMSSTGFN